MIAAVDSRYEQQNNKSAAAARQITNCFIHIGSLSQLSPAFVGA